MRRLRAWFAATHSGGSRAPPAWPLRAGCEELADGGRKCPREARPGAGDHLARDESHRRSGAPRGERVDRKTRAAPQRSRWRPAPLVAPRGVGCASRRSAPSVLAEGEVLAPSCWARRAAALVQGTEADRAAAPAPRHRPCAQPNLPLQDFDIIGETTMRGDETRLKQTAPIKVLVEDGCLPPPNDPGNRPICEPRFPQRGFRFFGPRFRPPATSARRWLAADRGQSIAQRRGSGFMALAR